MYGTASRVDLWLLLEYTRPWTSNILTNNDLAPRVKLSIRRILELNSYSRLLFIRNHHRRTKSPMLFVISSKESNPFVKHFQLSAYEDLVSLDPEHLLAANPGAEYTNPLFLVCTDGHHDRCCARYGLSIYRELARLVGTLAWQCTHVGGDRFAANLICFPHGIYYGHVEQGDLAKIVSLYEEKSIYLPRFRGRACFSRHIQIAECFVRERNEQVRLGDLQFSEIHEFNDQRWMASFISARNKKICKVFFTRSLSTFFERATCNAEVEEQVDQYSLLSYEESPVAFGLRPAPTEAGLR